MVADGVNRKYKRFELIFDGVKGELKTESK